VSIENAVAVIFHNFHHKNISFTNQKQGLCLF